MIGRHAFEAADCNRLVFDAATTARRLTGTITDSSEDARKYVGLAVLHVRIAELPLGNHANVLRNVGMGGTAPLTVYDPVEVLGIGSICWLHSDD